MTEIKIHSYTNCTEAKFKNRRVIVFGSDESFTINIKKLITDEIEKQDVKHREVIKDKIVLSYFSMSVEAAYSLYNCLAYELSKLEKK